MLLSFNPEKLLPLLKDFYNVTGVRITVFDRDFQEVAAYPAERAQVCRLIRRDGEARARCTLCDQAACRRAADKREAYVYRCHAGLTEAIMPIRLGGLTAGYLFFGHAFCYPDFDAGFLAVAQNCREYQVDRQALGRALRQSPMMTEEYLLSAARLLRATAGYLCLEHMVTLNPEELPVRLDRYIAEHIAGDLRPQTLCKQFGLGKTRLYEICRENYGMGLAAFVRGQRLEKAKQMLREKPALPVGEVAARCGFGDYNYFITLFKRHTGFSPKAYGKRS